jgi:methyl-accepting chemotaxis protein
MEVTKPIGTDFTMWFQIKYCLAMITSLAATSLIIYLYFRHGLKEGYSEALTTLTQVEQTLPAALLVTFILQSLLILFFSIAINLFVSHKIAGPIYRFEHTLRCIGNGDLQHVARIRDTDQINSMVSALNRLIASLRNSYTALHGIEKELDLVICQQENGKNPDLLELRRRIAHSRMHLGCTSDRRVDE